MSNEVLKQIIDLVKKAAVLARGIGFPNLLQPGLVKEMMIAGILGHEVSKEKHNADAHAIGDPRVMYEYLTCKEGGSGQLDRMQNDENSLSRISRNHKIYFAVFYESEQTKCKVIYEIEPSILRTETVRQLTVSKNVISHVGFSEKWAKTNGKIVYESDGFTES